MHVRGRYKWGFRLCPSLPVCPSPCPVPSLLSLCPGWTSYWLWLSPRLWCDGQGHRYSEVHVTVMSEPNRDRAPLTRLVDWQLITDTLHNWAEETGQPPPASHAGLEPINVCLRFMSHRKWPCLRPGLALVHPTLLWWDGVNSSLHQSIVLESWGMEELRQYSDFNLR